MPSRLDIPYVQSSFHDPVLAEKVKQRMLKFHEKLQGLGCSIVMLHDEWIIEAPDDKKEQVLELITEQLKEYVADLMKSVGPLKLPVHPEGKEWP